MAVRVSKSKVEAAGKNGDGAAEDGVQVAAERISITPPNMKVIQLTIVGTSPLVQNRFGEKARNIMQEAQEAGSQGKKGKKREPKDFVRCYNDARHIAVRNVDGTPIAEPWDGIHAGGFRRAMVDACSVVGFHMTKAKKTLFVRPNGFSLDGSPLVKITKGKPEMHIGPVRNSSGVADLRARPLWQPGWEAVLTLEFDNDLFSVLDIANLLNRVGIQCGIAEGRPNSKESTGCGWGTFRIEGNPLVLA